MSAYRELTKKHLSKCARHFRDGQNMTQQALAEELRITPRAYGDLERGKYCFSAVALLFFLSLLSPDDLRTLLEEFTQKVHVLESMEVA